VPKPVLHDFQVVSLGDQQARAAVPQPMKRNLVKLMLLYQLDEFAAYSHTT